MSMRIVPTATFFLAIVVGLFSLFGCDSTAESNANALIRTERTTYKMGDTIRVGVTSVSGSGIYYLCKGQIRLQQMNGGTVRNSWDVYGFDLCDRKTEIALGETATFTILPSDMADVFADPNFDPAAQYRFQFDLYSDPECTKLLDNESDRLSNNVALTR